MRALLVALGAAVLLPACRGSSGGSAPGRDLGPDVVRNFQSLASAGAYLRAIPTSLTVVVPPPPEPTPCELPAGSELRLFAGSGTGGLPYAEWGTPSGGTVEVCSCAGLRTCTFAR